jgi:hypothetical protein
MDAQAEHIRRPAAIGMDRRDIGIAPQDGSEHILQMLVLRPAAQRQIEVDPVVDRLDPEARHLDHRHDSEAPVETRLLPVDRFQTVATRDRAGPFGERKLDRD